MANNCSYGPDPANYNLSLAYSAANNIYYDIVLTLEDSCYGAIKTPNNTQLNRLSEAIVKLSNTRSEGNYK